VIKIHVVFSPIQEEEVQPRSSLAEEMQMPVLFSTRIGHR